MKAIARHSRVHLGGHEERIDQFGRPTGGFNFDNAHRNIMLGASTGIASSINATDYRNSKLFCFLAL